MSIRTRALPTLAAATLLTLCGCAATTPTAARPADPTTAAAQTSPTPTAAGLPTGPAATGAPKVTLATPTPSGAPAATGTPKVTLASPSPSGAPAATGTPDLKLDSYNQQTGEAVLAAADSTTPNAAPSTAGAAAAGVHAGQLIDSPPSPAAPRGALVAITDARPADGGKVAVSTRPATLPELLGQSTAALRSALDPHTVQIQPQVKDLKVSFTTRPGGGQASASAGLELDADTTVPLPGGASAALAGSLELDPSVSFSYQGGAGLLSPQQAKVGFDLGAHANWHISAGLTASTGPVRIPLAKLTASPVLMVGQLPVVVNLDLTLTAEISADGTVTIDTQQDIAGTWAVHADYAKGSGWTTAGDPLSTTVSPVRAKLSGNASVRTGLAAEGSIALYDTLGVKATVEPYLRTSVNGTLTIDSSGAAPNLSGTAALYGGIDINGALMARIAIFGTPLLEKDLPLPVFHREWPIVLRGIGSGTVTAAPSSSPKN